MDPIVVLSGLFAFWGGIVVGVCVALIMGAYIFAQDEFSRKDDE